MGIKPKAIARIGSRSVLIPFPTKGEASLAPPIPLAPHEPTGVTASAGIFTVEVALSWTDASNNEDGFYVYRNTSNTTTGATLIKTLGAGVQAYTDNAANSGAYPPAEGATYFYWVSSFNAGGESAKSPAASNALGGETTIWLVPTAPSSLSATAVSSSQINLSWTDNSNNETGFEIFRSTDGITFSSIATVGAGVTTYNNTGLSASTQYYYKVWAYNPGENSTYSNTANATTQAGGVPAATFDLNFTTDPYVGTRFGRASRATFVNSSGFIQAAETNLALYSNQLNNSYWTVGSETITANAAVAPDGTSTAARHTELSTTSFHGMQRSSVAGVTAGSPHTFSIYVKRDPTSPSVRNVSLWLYYDLSATPNSSRNGVLFNTATGAYINQSTFNSSGVSYGSEDVGNGWFRYWVTVTAPATATGMRCGIYMFQDGTTTLTDYRAETYAGNGSSVLYWGPQLVASASRLPYVHTAASAVGTPRITHDPVTLAPLGLLMEPAATNNLLRSEDWSAVWVLAGSTQTANSATSPSGVSNGTRLSEDTTVGAHETYQSIGASQNYCFSVFLKAQQRTAASTTIYRAANDWVTCTFNLSAGTAGTVAVGSASGWSNAAATIENYGNGWYRCSVRATHSSSSGSFAGISLNSSATPTRQANNGIEGYAGNTANGLLAWGAQVEFTNAPPTSYIPTAAATVTRSADGWNIMPAEMSTLWNQSQGSLVAKGRIYTPFTNGGLARVGVGGTNANSYFTSIASSQVRPAIRVAGANFSSGPTGLPTSGAVVNIGFSYNQATPAFTGFVGGTAGSTLTNSLSAVTIDRLEVGTRIENSMAAGTNIGLASSIYVIERLRYWNTALSNADMQTATT